MQRPAPPGLTASPGLTGLVAAGLIVIAGLLLGGCARGAGSSGSAAAFGTGSGRSPAAGRAQAGEPAAAGQPAGGGGTSTAARLAPASQDVVHTASLRIRVASVRGAAARARQLASRAGGYVASENAALPGAHQAGGTASMVLKIPVTGYPAALSELAGSLGTETYLQQQARDVTQQVADTASLVTSDEAAIAALRALLRRAGSVAALLTVQDQISAQESALEAMQAQQRALDRETAYATVSLRLTGPAAAVGHKPRPSGGFTSGLRAGWHALLASVTWLLRALGAVLPIGAVIIAAGLAGLAGRRMLRRRAGA